jgi:bifunctional DNA-binding transcriptional regulator/antitoxin component of YhaV-PrlF toxin-antitoxin module
MNGTVSGTTVGEDGRVALSEETRQRYRLLPDTPLRVIETRGGILLVPLTGGPMSPELAAELSQWQALGAGSWDQFPYESGTR